MEAIRVKSIISILCALAIVLSFAATAAGAARAAEPEGLLVLSFADIEGLVTKGNPTIRNNEITAQNLDGAYDPNEMIFALSSSYNYFDSLSRSAKAVIARIMAGADPSAPESDPVRDGVIMALESDIAAYESEMAQIRAQLDQLFVSPRPAIDRTIQQLGNANMLIVWGAEGLFMGCHALSRQIAKSNGDLKTLDSSISVMELRYSLGLAAGSALLAARNDRAQLELSIKGMENELRNLHGQMNLLLGRKHDAPLQLGSAPAAVKGFLKTVDRERDLKAATGNSHPVKIATIDINEQKGQSGSSARLQEAIATNSYDSEVRAVALRYESLVATIAEREAALSLAESLLAQKRQALEETKKRHGLGLVPKIALEQAENDVSLQKFSVDAADAELFIAIRRYEWLVRGVSA